MPHQRYLFDITLTLKTPLITASAEPSKLGIDVPMLRDHRDDFCIAGSLIQGRLLEECNNWASAEHPAFKALAARLGERANERNSPRRKQLVFTDFVWRANPNPNQNPTPPSATHTRIQINESTGTVETGQLLVIEAIAKPGVCIPFTGTAYAYCADDSEAKALAGEIKAALGLVPSFGADTTVGYGENCGVDVKCANAPLAKFTDPLGAETLALAFALTFDRPFVVTERMVSDNLFVGSDIVPGNVLKGALVDTWRALLGKPASARITEKDFDPNRSSLCTHFDHIVFRHAFCASGGERPRMMPASVAQIDRDASGKKTKLAVDLATREHPVVLQCTNDTNTTVAAQAVAFEIDWKEDPLVHSSAINNQVTPRDHFGWFKPTTSLRVRTAIDTNSRAAAHSQLFAYQQVVHERNVGTEEGPDDWQSNVWRTEVNLSAIKNATERKNVATQLIEILSHGLSFVGKTKAHVTVSQGKQPMRRTTELAAAQSITLVLQTPALLLEPGVLNETSGHSELLAAYRKTFDHLSGSTLELSHFYATQSLMGGGYQQRRFGDGSDTNDAYAPWTLTNAGSVFVFKAPALNNADTAQTKIADWLATGLPIAEHLPPHYKDWQRNPYQPANGFGEILCNYAEHQTWSPTALGFTPIDVVLAA